MRNFRVMAKVSCEVGQPKQTRPTEGFLYINVEFSPMAEAHFEPGKQTEQANEMARVLERCLRDSRAVDLESLCIMAGAKVLSFFIFFFLILIIQI